MRFVYLFMFVCCLVQGFCFSAVASSTTAGIGTLEKGGRKTLQGTNEKRTCKNWTPLVFEILIKTDM